MPIIRNQKTKGVHYKQNVAPNVNVDIGDTYYYKNRGDFYNRVSNVENLGLINEFRAITYTGNGGTNPITGLGFQPDLVWIKNRDQAYNHRLFDSIRGTNISIEPDSTNPQSVKSQPELTSYDSDGFTVGSNIVVNQNTNNIIAWCWKCPNDASHASHDGEKYNTESGISIIKYTGNGVAGRTITHSLGRKPNLVIVKNLSAAASWAVYHDSLDITSGNALSLDLPDAESYLPAYWNSTETTSTQVTLGNGLSTGNDTNEYIAYLFAEIPNYSKFGSYIGNASLNGPRITLDFEPAFLIIKNITTGSTSWFMYDNKRSTQNPRTVFMAADSSTGDQDLSSVAIDFLEDGFQMRTQDGSLNANNNQYIYIAFADTTQTTSTWNRVLGGWGPGSDYGYIAGGYSGSFLSTIERLIFPFDSGTTSIVGNLNESAQGRSGNNSSIHGYIIGGQTPTYLSNIDRILFPFNSGTSTRVGNLSGIRNNCIANNSSIHGFIGAGHNSSSSTSIIDRITFPFDSGNATTLGTLNSNRYFGANNNSSIHGYFNAGYLVSGTYSTTIDRIIFPFDSGNANNVGNLSYSCYGVADFNSSQHGYSMGGHPGGSTYFSNIDRIIFPFDSGTSSHVGNLSQSNYGATGFNSTEYGYSIGGNPTVYKSIIERIQFPFDSGTSVVVGNINTAKYSIAGFDGVDFVSQFADWATN